MLCGPLTGVTRTPGTAWTRAIVRDREGHADSRDKGQTEVATVLFPG